MLQNTIGLRTPLVGFSLMRNQSLDERSFRKWRLASQQKITANSQDYKCPIEHPQCACRRPAPEKDSLQFPVLAR